MSARAAKPKPRLLAWLAVCAVALALLLYVLSVVVDDDGGGTDGGSATPAWQPLPAPPASGEVTLVEAAGRLLVVTGSTVRELDEDGGRWSEPVPIPGPPRSGETIVGTPDELIVWGGQTDDDGGLRNDGYAYVPGSPDWRQVADAPLSARQGATGIWTGREVVVVGGGPNAARTEVGTAAYDPAGDAWRRLPSADRLAQTSIMASAWTGEQVAVWAYREASAEAALLTLDVEGDDWIEIAPPPFPPPVRGSGLAGNQTALVATATGIGPAQAAVHPPDQARALEQWRPLASPPIPTDELCPSELAQAAGRTVLLSECNHELFMLGDGTWHPLPRPSAGTPEAPESSAGRPAQTLVTDDAVYYLAPGAAGVAPSLLRLEMP